MGSRGEWYGMERMSKSNRSLVLGTHAVVVHHLITLELIRYTRPTALTRPTLGECGDSPATIMPTRRQQSDVSRSPFSRSSLPG